MPRPLSKRECDPDARVALPMHIRVCLQDVRTYSASQRNVQWEWTTNFVR